MRARPLVKHELAQICGLLRIQANELTVKGYLRSIRDFLRMQNLRDPNVPDDQPFPMMAGGPVPAKGEDPSDSGDDPSDS
jgi:hypothetical protein